MGMRGPVGMDPDTRAARGGRDRSTPFRNEAAKRAWAARAEKLEALGMLLIERASKRPTAKTPSNGQQMTAQLKAGLELLEAADKLWSRLTRVGAPNDPPPAGAAGPAKPRSLADYRRG